INGLICLESDNDSENGSMNETWKQNETMLNSIELTIPLVAKDSNLSSRYIESRLPSDAFREVTQEILTGNVHVAQVFGYSFSHPNSSEDDIVQLLSESFKDFKLLVVGVNFLTIEVLFAIAYYHKVPYCPEQEIDRLELIDNVLRPKGKCKDNAYKKRNMDEAIGKRRISKEERVRLKEEKKQQKEQEKLQKEVLRAEAVEMKKLQKERQKWEKGKFALKSIVAEIDPKIVELGSVGGTAFLYTAYIYFCNSISISDVLKLSCIYVHPSWIVNFSREEQMRMLGEGFSKLGTLLAKLKTMKRGIEERGKNIGMSVHKLGGNKDNNRKDMTIGNVLKQTVNDV
ncbi:unnamed protein product, partial [Ilex paraguariensis]